MSRLDVFANLSEVKDGIICDRFGALLEHSQKEDAESISTVMGYFVGMVSQCGDMLGFSEPSKMIISGSGLSCMVVLKKDSIWTIYLDPGRSLREFETKIDAIDFREV